MKKFILITFLIPHLLYAGWHDRKCEGWAYYEEQAVPEEKEENEEQEKRKSSSQQLEECKQEMQDALAAAILEPTEENSRRYLELQNRWLARATDVSKVWAKVILQNPELDNSLSGMPVSSYGANFYHKQKSEKQKELIHALANTHSLVCFYEGRNMASKEFSKVIAMFSKRHDWVVQPISVDGIILPEFPESVPDRGLKEQLGVSHYPAVYVIEPNKNIAVPVGFGLLSVDMIETNISLQFREEFEEGSVNSKNGEIR